MQVVTSQLIWQSIKFVILVQLVRFQPIIKYYLHLLPFYQKIMREIDKILNQKYKECIKLMQKNNLDEIEFPKDLVYVLYQAGDDIVDIPISKVRIINSSVLYLYNEEYGWIYSYETLGYTDINILDMIFQILAQSLVFSSLIFSVDTI